MSSEKELLVYYLGILVPLWIAIIAARFWVVRRVKKLHPDVAQRLDAEKEIFKSLADMRREAKALGRFIRRREFLATGDSLLASVCNLLRVAEPVAWVLFLLFVLLFGVSVVK